MPVIPKKKDDRLPQRLGLGYLQVCDDVLKGDCPRHRNFGADLLTRLSNQQIMNLVDSWVPELVGTDDRCCGLLLLLDLIEDFIVVEGLQFVRGVTFVHTLTGA